MGYDYAMEKRDYARIDKLNNLTDVDTFWNDVRRLTSQVKGSHAGSRWQILAEARYRELKGE